MLHQLKRKGNHMCSVTLEPFGLECQKSKNYASGNGNNPWHVCQGAHTPYSRAYVKIRGLIILNQLRLGLVCPRDVREAVHRHVKYSVDLLRYYHKQIFRYGFYSPLVVWETLNVIQTQASTWKCWYQVNSQVWLYKVNLFCWINQNTWVSAAPQLCFPAKNECGGSHSVQYGCLNLNSPGS